jgi:phospholipid-binding lipoprotein MlaA
MPTQAMLSRLALSLLLAVAVGLGGCATGPDADPRDPLEPFNRGMFQFNDDLDQAFIQPLAKGYNAIMPGPLNQGVTNFFDNLRDVDSAVNNLLQLKIGRAFSDLGRVAVNTTVGILGFVDVASNLNLPSYKEDFGQTLGVWGFETGPYLVLPFFGPSSGRDGVGVVVDWFIDPLYFIDDDGLKWGLRGLRLVDTRADLLNASRVFSQAALDPYSFIRDAYLQRRRSQVFDGNPPEEELDFE